MNDNDQQVLIRNTVRGSGWTRYATPGNTALQYLSCGWVRLDAGTPSIERKSGSEELSLIVTAGSGLARTAAGNFELNKFDAVFIPPDQSFSLSTEQQLVLAEAAAPSSIGGDPQHISFERTLADERLTVAAGDSGYARQVVKLIDQNVKAERLLCGLTFGAPGNWTSWSPHEHASSREEVYLYIDMPPPSFGIQMIYKDLHDVDLIAPVFENDAVVITEGYHPNAGIPGFGINFVWMMAGLHPQTDREWADMNWQEEFSGLYK
jgi:5-deoxy-glucuronate isomerase